MSRLRTFYRSTIRTRDNRHNAIGHHHHGCLGFRAPDRLNCRDSRRCWSLHLHALSSLAWLSQTYCAHQVGQGPGVGGRQEGLHPRSVLRHEPGHAEGACRDLKSFRCASDALTFYSGTDNRHTGGLKLRTSSSTGVVLPPLFWHSLQSECSHNSASVAGPSSGSGSCLQCGVRCLVSARVSSSLMSAKQCQSTWWFG